MLNGKKFSKVVKEFKCWVGGEIFFFSEFWGEKDLKNRYRYR